MPTLVSFLDVLLVLPALCLLWLPEIPMVLRLILFLYKLPKDFHLYVQGPMLLRVLTSFHMELHMHGKNTQLCAKTSTSLTPRTLLLHPHLMLMRS